ncbi:hypothetical protein QL093DRAFT_2380314 [Fusarium oxysporum]|nr:hypothetical protein QL093DRAFT_2380314 [Fusarium oxysporum]
MASNSTVVESGPESLTTPHLELVNGQVPYRDAVVSWKIPKVELLGEERYIDSFESDCVTHVVLQVNDREFVGFENKNYPKSSNSTDINAVEVSLKRPRPNEPMEVFWRPARGIIIQRLRECKNREGYTSGL